MEANEDYFSKNGAGGARAHIAASAQPARAMHP